MNTVIQFTPSQLLAAFLAACGAIITVSTVIGIIAKAIEKARAPEAEQNKRLDALERRMDAHDKVIERFDGYFANDDARFKEIEHGNKIIQSALLALLKHSLNGNDTESLKEAEKELEAYLINK